MENLPTLLSIVEKKCPALCPVFLPNGVTEKTAIRKYSEKNHISEPCGKCDICGASEKELVHQVVCSYDLKNRKCVVNGVKNVCRLCKFSMNASKIMELLVNEERNNEEEDMFIRHFLLVNGHNPENQALLEELVSCCYSLHVILRNYLSSIVLAYSLF